MSFRENDCRVNEQYKSPAAMGNTAAISRFRSNPAAMAARVARAQRERCSSLSSRARRNPQTAVVTVRVRMTSAIKTRVIVDAKNRKRRRDHPIFQRRLLEISDAVEMGCDPIARLQHVTRDLSLYCVHIVHQGRRTDDASQENQRRDTCDNYGIVTGARDARGASSGAATTLHRFIHRNSVINPHKW